MHDIHGRCHCGNLELRLQSETAPADFPVRACQCSFCRKHGVRAVADPAGLVDITVHDADKLVRYQFGHKAAEFFVCANCGVYIAAVMDDGERTYATLIVNSFDDHESFTSGPEPVSYLGEDEAGRRQRRRDNWTPTTVTLD